MIRKCTSCPNEYEESTSTAMNTAKFCCGECELECMVVDMQVEVMPLFDQIVSAMYRNARRMAGKEPIQ